MLSTKTDVRFCSTACIVKHIFVFMLSHVESLNVEKAGYFLCMHTDFKRCQEDIICNETPRKQTRLSANKIFALEILDISFPTTQVEGRLLNISCDTYLYDFHFYSPQSST